MPPGARQSGSANYGRNAKRGEARAQSDQAFADEFHRVRVRKLDPGDRVHRAGKRLEGVDRNRNHRRAERLHEVRHGVFEIRHIGAEIASRDVAIGLAAQRLVIQRGVSLDL